MTRVSPETTKKNAPRVAMHSTRAKPAREQPHVATHTPARVRTRKATVNESPFYIPVEEIPHGLTYEWKRWSVNGLHDPFYISAMRNQGWEPVSPKMHPTWVPPGYAEPHIIKDGQILMERPEELTKEARAELKQLSKTQVREAEQRLGMAARKLSGGDASESLLAEVGSKLHKEYGRLVAEGD